MTDVNVRVGTGSFDEFEILTDALWPVVPREDEAIVLGSTAAASFGGSDACATLSTLRKPSAQKCWFHVRS
jgi:hypothetical protein